ncbi:hypothetical protein GGS26DRAFT_574260 [Hypomontagnella submonticulosa]|nr:hypothetical protein GGS26DRAFT_574260 [Hypomontagnella submonticulosa]
MPQSPKPKDTKNDRSSSSNFARDNTGKTEIPVRQPPTPVTAAGDQSKEGTSVSAAYQSPAPGFDQSVRNVPGVGLVYNDNSNATNAANPIHGINPATFQQPQLGHHIPGAAPPKTLPPNFFQSPSQVVPQFLPVGQQQQSIMAYTTSFMPNQGQHFQPPVPDTTYGPIPHTYHPRFDNSEPAVSGQYTTVNGQLYQRVGTTLVPETVPGGGQVHYVPAHQPASGVATAPVVIQQGSQQPVYVQGQPGVTYISHPGQVASQPAAFPAMVGHPQFQMAAGSGMPGAMPGAMPGHPPDVMGVGKTGMEVQMEQYHTALNSKALDGQDIAPADPDPSRMYYCRELDGEWTLRNRYGIDNLGDCRWYVMPGGVFYAVRLAD